MIINNKSVKSPSHYRLDGLDIESKDVVKSLLGYEGYEAWCYGNALKYLFRWKKKNGEEDLLKCIEYIQWILDLYNEIRDRKQRDSIQKELEDAFKNLDTKGKIVNGASPIIVDEEYQRKLKHQDEIDKQKLYMLVDKVFNEKHNV